MRRRGAHVPRRFVDGLSQVVPMQGMFDYGDTDASPFFLVDALHITAGRDSRKARPWRVMLARAGPVLCRLVVALSPGCRLRSGRFDRLPALESLFFCWPKRKVTQRNGLKAMAAWHGDKPERLKTVVAGQPPPIHSGYFKAAQRAVAMRA